MSIERVKQLIKQKENIRLEFKEAAFALPGNLFETICAMLNRDGGDIFLGIDEHNVLKGVEPAHLDSLVTNLVNLSNNPQKLDPPFILFPLIYNIGGKEVVHIQVPASSQLHKTAGVVFDRSNDGDFKVFQPQQVAEMYNRKRSFYTEGIIYAVLQFSDFKAELFPKIRNLISSNNSNHPWLALDNKQMLEVAGLWRRDFQTGQEGYTLAAALLFGKDEVIQQILPHFKIDALVRIQNPQRYDDREYIQTNLIDAYEHLMAFVAKHLPDKFYMEGDQRVSLRTKIFREIIANLIVHREYTNAHPCTFIIYADKIETANANNPHGEGPIDLNNFAPFPKNPAIAKFFIQLGRVDELGSGVLNVNRLLDEYAGGSQPQFIEGHVFKTILPIPAIDNITDDTVNAIDTVNETDDTVNETDDTVNETDDTVNETDDTVNETDDTVNETDDTVNETDETDDTVNETDETDDTVNTTDDTDSIVIDTINETVADTVNKTVKARLTEAVLYMLKHPGLRSNELAEMLEVSGITVRRDMQKIKKLVEFKGSPKRGGYYLTGYMHDKLLNKTQD